MSGHTPGPWLIKHGETYRNEVVSDVPRVVLARVTVPQDYGIRTTERWAVADANAALMAAAPDLLAAPEEMVEAHESADTVLGARALAAIAKARGGK